MIELWNVGGAVSSTSFELAQEREAEGWDGQTFMDSQSISADPYAMMGAWAVATKQLKFATSTTNPLTRHPVVTAASAATIQAMSGGRAILGIGRGDSALAYLGYAPAKLKIFQRTLLELQTLLSGGEIAFNSHESIGATASADSLSLGNRPKAARLQWLDKTIPKVPLDVAATGPKVIQLAAPIAERISFSVGAIPERISWAIETARQARADQGLDDKGINYGAQVVVICHPNAESIQDISASIVAPFARFQVMQSNGAGPLSEGDKKDFAAVRSGYDMTRHGETFAHEKLSGAVLSPDFVRRFAIIGPPEYCIQRLLELHALGINRFVVVGPGFYPEPEPKTPNLFVREVIPAIRAATS